jgi:hypothetical protein
VQITFLFRPSCLDTVPKNSCKFNPHWAPTRHDYLLFQPMQSSRLRRRRQIRVINYIIMPPVSREDGADHISFIARLASIRCHKIPANSIPIRHLLGMTILFQPKQSSRVRRRKQIRVINYIIMPPVSREDGADHISFLPVLPRYGAGNSCKFNPH